MHSILVPTVSGLVTYGIIPPFLQLLRNGGAIRRNYRGDTIPVGVGFLLVWGGCITGPLLLLPFPFRLSPVLHLSAGSMPGSILLFSATALGYGFLGLFDDLVGSRQDTGLRGHGVALGQGRLTSGAVKALVGVAFGLTLAAYRLGLAEAFSRQWLFPLLVDGLLIAALANTLNLLDLRPGRAGKAFLFSSVLLIFTGEPMALGLLPWIGSLLGYFPFDLRGEAMMGDAGSNALGALLGLTSCYGLSFGAKSIILLGLILTHIFAERVSFSAVIENCPLLKTLDSWGRKER